MDSVWKFLPAVFNQISDISYIFWVKKDQRGYTKKSDFFSIQFEKKIVIEFQIVCNTISKSDVVSILCQKLILCPSDAAVICCTPWISLLPEYCHFLCWLAFFWLFSWLLPGVFTFQFIVVTVNILIFMTANFMWILSSEHICEYQLSQF